MTFAIVKVFPEPVTPSRVWWASPAPIPSTSRSIAAGWSPAEAKSETTARGRGFMGTIVHRHGHTTRAHGRLGGGGGRAQAGILPSLVNGTGRAAIGRLS